MEGEGEDRFDGLLLRLAREHTEGGITEVCLSHLTRVLGGGRYLEYNSGLELARACSVHFEPRVSRTWSRLQRAF